MQEDKPIDHRKLLKHKDPMPFGKYKGRELKYVPDNYLKFLWRQCHFSAFQELRGTAGYIAEYIERRFIEKQTPLKKPQPRKIIYHTV